MLPVITSTQMKAIITESVKYGDTKPLLFLGKTGIGKTETVKAVCDEQEIGHIDIRILNHNETDFKGLPYPDADRVFTVYLQNKMFPIAERDGDRGILVLDEITSGYRSVRTAVYQLLQERCIGEYKLPDGWMIVCLGNGEADGGDFNGIESAFGARCECYRVNSTLKDYLRYANQHNGNPLVSAFLEWMPQCLHTYDPDKDGTEECLGFACNRAWTRVSDILNRKGITFTSGDISEADKIRIQGTVGTRDGLLFLPFVDYKREIVSVMDIANGKNVQPPKRPETLYLTVQSIKDLMCEIINNSGYDGDDRTLSNQTMTQIANCLLWFINNIGPNGTSIEMTISCVAGWVQKAEMALTMWASSKFTDFCSEGKYAEINKFFEKHDNLFD